MAFLSLLVKWVLTETQGTGRNSEIIGSNLSVLRLKPGCLSHFLHVLLYAAPWTATHQASLSFTISQSLLKPTSNESVMPSSHLILCHLLLLLPSVFLNIRVFSNESSLRIRWPKYWSFSFSIGPSNEYSGLISFRMDCLDLFAVQGTLKSLLHCCSFILYIE